MTDKVLLRPSEAAELLAVGRSRLFELMASGELRSVKIGRSRRVPVAALTEYVERLVEAGVRHGS
jgi:excisionase family DNA binding protein